ncbi:hypothetical protein AABB24_004375 [Solanum stoloniferum]|uniref:Uncharacterized protein n=1 Tax=Solanum stoloniferum TaxID=62892 RepID=A0ABD2VDH8_9SOLN
MSFHSACDIEKRSRSQIYPLFLFNLNCPRSLYNSTLEPSKTSVEFKESLVVTKWFLMLLVGRCEDWHPVLLFIEDTVTNLWTVSTGESNRSINFFMQHHLAFIVFDVICTCGFVHFTFPFLLAAATTCFPKRGQIVEGWLVEERVTYASDGRNHFSVTPSCSFITFFSLKLLGFGKPR